MAQANHEIRLTAVDKTGPEVKKVETKLEKLTRLAKGITLGSIDVTTSVAKRNIDDYVQTLGKLDKKLNRVGGRLGDVARAFDFGGKTVVGVSALNALSDVLSKIPENWTWLESLKEFGTVATAITAPVNLVNEALISVSYTHLRAHET